MPPQPNIEKLLKNLADLDGRPTAHGSGVKKVFRSNGEMPSNLTQVAFGSFNKGEKCEEHIHPTMDEYFFFLRGEGVYTIAEKDYELKANIFLEIPAGAPHSLKATSDTPLEFVYWGVAREV